jgi:hypothetical protein
MKRLLAAGALSIVCLLILVAARDPQPDPRLKKSFRRAQQNGWTYVHLEGSPSEVGFQHGYLLAREMEDLLKVITLQLTHV